MLAIFNTYKVLIFGFLMAIAIPLHDLSATGTTSTKAIVFAVATAGLSFLARNLRGQWATILGIFGSILAYYATQTTVAGVNWLDMISFLLIQVGGVFMPPAKSIGYERTITIENAKAQGEQSIPTLAKPQP